LVLYKSTSFLSLRDVITTFLRASNRAAVEKVIGDEVRC